MEDVLSYICTNNSDFYYHLDIATVKLDSFVENWEPSMKEHIYNFVDVFISYTMIYGDDHRLGWTYLGYEGFCNKFLHNAHEELLTSPEDCHELYNAFKSGISTVMEDTLSYICTNNSDFYHHLVDATDKLDSYIQDYWDGYAMYFEPPESDDDEPYYEDPEERAIREEMADAERAADNNDPFALFNDDRFMRLLLESMVINEERRRLLENPPIPRIMDGRRIRLSAMSG